MLFMVIVFVFVVVLYALIASINHGDHFAPQAYYRRKRGGAPVAYGYPSLVPRYRRKAPAELEPPDTTAHGS